MSIYDDSRAAWGAARNTNPRPVAASARLGISWHYDGGAALNLAGRPHSACLTRVKADQRFHQSPARGWADIGYNLLVCQHGRVIEGRGVDLQGAHSPGVNVTHYGVQFMVGGSEAPTAAAYARAARLARDLAAHSGRTLRQWGHRDDPSASTECPGSGIEAWVKRQGSATPTLSVPINPTPAPVPEEDDMAMTPAERAALITDIADAVLNSPVPRPGTDKTWPLKTAIWSANTYALQAASRNIDVTALANAVAAKMPADADLTKEDIKAALGEALAESVEVTGSLTVAPRPEA